MKNFPSQRAYILEHLQDAKNNLTIEEIRQEYRKLYFREYNKRRNNRNKMTLRPTSKELKYLTEKKKEYSKQSMNRFIIDCAIAYLKKEYKAHHPDVVKQLTTEINRIGTNINQIVHKLHLLIFQTEKDTYASDFSTESMYRILNGYEELKKQTDLVRKNIKEFMAVPAPHIANISWDEIKANKPKLTQLIVYLDEHLATLK